MPLIATALFLRLRAERRKSQRLQAEIERLSAALARSASPSTLHLDCDVPPYSPTFTSPSPSRAASLRNSWATPREDWETDTDSAIWSPDALAEATWGSGCVSMGSYASCLEAGSGPFELDSSPVEQPVAFELEAGPVAELEGDSPVSPCRPRLDRRLFSFEIEEGLPRYEECVDELGFVDCVVEKRRPLC